MEASNKAWRGRRGGLWAIRSEPSGLGFPRRARGLRADSPFWFSRMVQDFEKCLFDSKTRGSKIYGYRKIVTPRSTI